MNKVREIIRDCQRIIHSDHSYNRHSYYCVNVAKNIQRQLELFRYLNEQLDVLKQCLNEYVERKGSDDYKSFLREWLKYGVNVLTEHVDTRLKYNYRSDILPPDMKEVWSPFYGDSSFANYILSFPQTMEIVSLTHKKDKISECDDEKILSIHANKQCMEDELLGGCFLCESMEYSWHDKLINSYRHTNYLFMNPDLHTSFINEWVEANPTFTDFKFPPTKCYEIDWYYKPYYTKKIITDYNNALLYAVESRSHYLQTGKTPLECLQSYTIQQTIESSLSRIKLDKATDFELFMYLWNHLDLYHVYIQLDSDRCNEILDML